MTNGLKRLTDYAVLVVLLQAKTYDAKTSAYPTDRSKQRRTMRRKNVSLFEKTTINKFFYWQRQFPNGILLSPDPEAIVRNGMQIRVSDF